MIHIYFTIIHNYCAIPVCRNRLEVSAMFYENKRDIFLLYCECNPLQYPLHVHQYIELVHVVKGILQMQIGTEKYLLQPGELAIIFPNVAHDYHVITAPSNPREKNTQLHILNCRLDYLPFHKTQMLTMFPKHPKLCASDIHPDVFYAEKRLFEINQEDYDQALVSSLVSLMVSRIFPNLDLTDYRELPPQDLSCDIVAYIGKHFQEEISLTSVAKHFGIGKYTLSRIFSNVLKMNFSAYINSLRIDYADYLLLSTDLGMMDVAIECGYHNQQTFYRLFKSIHGCTPKEYRQQRSPAVLAPAQSFVYEQDF